MNKQEYNKQYYADNKEPLKAKRREKYRLNRDKELAYQKKRRIKINKLLAAVKDISIS